MNFHKESENKSKGTEPAKEMFLSTVDRTPKCHLRMVGNRWETSESQIERWETSGRQIGEETAASSTPTLRKQECAPPWVGGDAIQTKKNVTGYCSRLFGTKPKTQKIPLSQTWLWYHVNCREYVNCQFIHNRNISIYTCYASLSKVSLLYLHPIIKPIINT